MNGMEMLFVEDAVNVSGRVEAVSTFSKIESDCCGIRCLTLSPPQAGEVSDTGVFSILDKQLNISFCRNAIA